MDEHQVLSYFKEKAKHLLVSLLVIWNQELAEWLFAVIASPIAQYSISGWETTEGISAVLISAKLQLQAKRRNRRTLFPLFFFGLSVSSGTAMWSVQPSSLALSSCFSSSHFQGKTGVTLSHGEMEAGRDAQLGQTSRQAPMWSCGGHRRWGEPPAGCDVSA